MGKAIKNEADAFPRSCVFARWVYQFASLLTGAVDLLGNTGRSAYHFIAQNVYFSLLQKVMLFSIPNMNRKYTDNGY